MPLKEESVQSATVIVGITSFEPSTLNGPWEMGNLGGLWRCMDTSRLCQTCPRARTAISNPTQDKFIKFFPRYSEKERGTAIGIVATTDYSVKDDGE